MFRFYTAGESHGQCLVAIVEGLPGGMAVDQSAINHEMRRRQLGYGRGARMKIESDVVEILSGVRDGRSLGSPMALRIENKDWENWQGIMAVERNETVQNLRAVTRPRPGHADLAGALKYHTHDMRDILERASARETAARVAVGALAKLFLREFGIEVYSHVIAIGPVAVSDDQMASLSLIELQARAEGSIVRCADPQKSAAMKDVIDQAKANGDTVGGVFEVIAHGLPAGLGSHTQWDRKLDGRLAQALMSIPAIKAVAIGDGIGTAALPGSQVHDEIFYDSGQQAFYRNTNRAGGLEGGITNGCDLRLRGFVKPISTLRRALQSVDVISKAPSPAAFERSDICVVPAAGVVGEAMVSLVLTEAMLEKFGGDSIAETRRNADAYLATVRQY
ncbi:MAG: chorismate synthase [Acidobacteria bacterium]|nr:chorismate synthase [Acidobacteriota bacterium]MBI3656743.1 chorismate synthase [Acidobacteriota bacterium]